ncbi:hypothetical protein [uncultured Amnibacterium sp.]|uniref:hypothetical protein n=1 Tax=uncultured Amnibacterium sp. TaxID=1631851 RepID=UPI0035CC6F86
MKHVMIADKSLLAGDEVIDLLIEYAALLGQESTADSIDVHAFGADGDEVMATFLLNGGTAIVAETTTSSLPSPDNAKAEQYLHSRIAHLRGQRTASAEDIAGVGVWDASDD